VKTCSYAFPGRGSKGLPIQRRGAALVEFAIVLPLLFLLVFGIIEVGRAISVQQIITNGAREGARAAILPRATDAGVYQTIDAYLTGAGVAGAGYTRTISPSLATAGANVPITVTVTVPYNSVTWLPVGSLSWFGGKSLHASAVMRKEQ
jgi:Flp pilus assembly protein TadG